MVNGRTTYGERVDPTLAKLIGDERASEFGRKAVDVLAIVGKCGGLRVLQNDHLQLAAGFLLAAAGYVRHIHESDSEFFEVSDAGYEMLTRMRG